MKVCDTCVRAAYSLRCNLLFGCCCLRRESRMLISKLLNTMMFSSKARCNMEFKSVSCWSNEFNSRTLYSSQNSRDRGEYINIAGWKEIFWSIHIMTCFEVWYSYIGCNESLIFVVVFFSMYSELPYVFSILEAETPDLHVTLCIHRGAW